ncbi:MAG: lactonase family protein [Actinomycetota bacterium]|nr:lactonase family protein [Actinomycetota bacterium]
MERSRPGAALVALGIALLGAAVGVGIVAERYDTGIGSQSSAALGEQPNGAAIIRPPAPPAPVGTLTQVAGPTGCVSLTGTGGACREFPALDGPVSVALSQDGQFVYVAAQNSDALVIFRRDAATGVLTPLPVPNGCISKSGTSGFCTVGRALNAARVVAPSPYEQVGAAKTVYVASLESDGIAVFRREDNGRLTQLPGKNGCVTRTGSDGQCKQAIGLYDPESIAVTGYGAGRRTLFVASWGSNALVRFGGAPEGSIYFRRCASAGGGGVCVNAKGLSRANSVAKFAGNVYVAASGGDRTVAAFAWDDTQYSDTMTQLPGPTGCISFAVGLPTCVRAVPAIAPEAVAVAPNGDYVYVAGYRSGASALVGFKRAMGPLGDQPGELSPLAPSIGCAFVRLSTSTVDPAGCAAARALHAPEFVTVSPDGKSIYVAAQDADAVAVFARNPATGGFTQLGGTKGCLSEGGASGCTLARGVDAPRSISVSPDGKHVYVAASVSDTVTLFRRQTG